MEAADSLFCKPLRGETLKVVTAPRETLGVANALGKTLGVDTFTFLLEVGGAPEVTLVSSLGVAVT